MCFRDPYDTLDSSTMRQLNAILLEEATTKEGRRQARKQKKELKRQEKEQKKIAKVKESLQQKHGSKIQPALVSRKKKYETSSRDSDDTDSHWYRRHRHQLEDSDDSSRMPKPKLSREDREGAPAHITHIEFGEFHSALPLAAAPPPPPEEP